MDKLIEKAVKLIRKYGNLDNPSEKPFFAAPDKKTPLANRYSWYDDEFHVLESGNKVYQKDYEQVTIPKMQYELFHKMPLLDIPNSEDYALIDVGSRLGEQVTRSFAEKRPNVQLVMVDFLNMSALMDEGNYAHIDDRIKRDPYTCAEELKTKVQVTGHIEDSVNRLLSANGFSNIKYIHKNLTLDDYDLGIKELVAHKRVFVTGFLNSDGLGNITARIGVKYRAERIYISNSSLEMIGPASGHFNDMKKALRPYMSDKEIDGIIRRIHDQRPYNVKRNNPKYSYEKKAEKQFAQVLKLLYMLGQQDFLDRNGYDVQLFYKHDKWGGEHYSLPDHYLVAQRK